MLTEGCSAAHLADSMPTQRRRHHFVQNAVVVVVIAVVVIVGFVFALVLSLAFEPRALGILWIQA